MPTDKRHGPSISVKMILTTTAMIVLIVVGFGFLNLLNIQRVYDYDTKNISKVFDDTLAAKKQLLSAQLERVGDATITGVAATSLNFFVNTDDPDLRSYIGEVPHKDKNIIFAYVLDGDQKLVAHSDQARNPKQEHVDFKDESWQKVIAAWQAKKGDAANQEPLLGPLEYVGPEGHVALFAMPVFLNGVQPTVNNIFDPRPEVRPQGFAVVGYSYAEIETATAAAQKEKEDATSAAKISEHNAQNATVLKTAIVGAVFVLLGTLLAILQGLRISKPIKMLAWRADQIARGDLETRVEVTSTDEIGLLGENFNYMADQLVVLLRQTAEKATLEKELEVARTIQETLVPGNDTIDRQFIKLAGYFQPASQCGGDWWTYHELKGGKTLVVIGDVTGHGVPSAMITAAAKAACDVARAVNDDDVSCTQLLEIMNKAIFESAKRKFVMTCFASILDPKTRTITYANAGHNFPYLYRPADGKGEFGSLMTRGNRLGDIPDSKYAAKTMELVPGDLLIWYTDGIVECENDRGEEYGEKRFRASIRRAAHLEPAEMREQVVASSLEFFGERPRKDDITMVIAKVY